MSTFFQSLQQSYLRYETLRREIIKISSDALSLSKQTIFALHRGDATGGEKLLGQVESLLSGMEKQFIKEPDLRGEGSYRAALEEYVEAKMFGRILTGETVGPIKEVKVDTDSYLGGLCDVFGEIARQIVLLATARQFKEVERLSKAAHQMMGELIKIDFTGYLRTKYDQAKQAMRRIEEVGYDMSMQNVKCKM